MSDPSADRVAAIDCGTNSVRLLIADRGADGLRDVIREMRIVRLGQGVDATGRLAVEAIERTRVALVEYAELIAEHGRPPIRMVATSATRDAANREDFVAMVRGALGIEPEVITGGAEAALSFSGAVAGLPSAVAPLLVADIGGGSTELVLGGDGAPLRSSGGDGAPLRSSGGDGAPLRSYSMDIGCVRLTERRLLDDPPTADQIEAALADIDAAISMASRDVPLQGAATFVGVAGTVTTLAALALRLPVYDSTRVHGSVLSAQQIRSLTETLLSMPRDERAALPALHPGRVDIIGAGALVLDRLMSATGADQLVASEHDILDGIALSLADRPIE